MTVVTDEPQRNIVFRTFNSRKLTYNLKNHGIQIQGFPTPNELAHEICKKVSIFEKKCDAKVLNDQSDAVAAELLAELKLEEKSNKDKSNKSNLKKKKNGKS